VRSAFIPWAGAALCLAVLLPPAPSHAGLGGTYNSVATDRLRLSAQSSATRAAANYTVHSMTTPGGGSVNEYTRGDGTVFAVTWQGPARPDLRQLLGDYFDRYRQNAGLTQGRRLRRPPHVSDSDFIVQTGGHPGSYFGLAFLPQVAPSGFSVSDLK
jgi:hypothetical protein